MRLLAAVSLGAALAMGSCTKQGPAPVTYPTPIPLDNGYDGGQQPCEQMCAHLAGLSCPEGQDQQQCTSLCVIITTDKRFSPTPEDAQRYINCRLNAKTPAAAQQCGPASCR
jgi:hypothetical protein